MLHVCLYQQNVNRLLPADLHISVITPPLSDSSVSPPINSQVSIISALIRRFYVKLRTHARSVCFHPSKMLFSVFTASLLCVLILKTQAENVHVQEKLFLRSMGLSSRPKPSAHSPVPSLLWKMFKSSKETESCVVSEYGVPGNIVRFIQDQGVTLLCF